MPLSLSLSLSLPLALVLVLALAGGARAVPASLSVSAGGTAVTLANGYTLLTFDLLRGALTAVRGRVEGDGVFPDTDPNAAPALRGASTATGVAVGALAVVVTGNGAPLAFQETATSAFTRTKPLPLVVVSNTSELVTVVVVGATDGGSMGGGVAAPRIAANITLTLAANARGFRVSVTTWAVASFNASVVRVSTGWTPTSPYALYTRGVRQGMQMTQPYIASAAPWSRWYGAGGQLGAVDILPGDASTATLPTVIFGGTWDSRGCGWDLILAGSVPLDSWMDGFEGSPAIAVAAGTVFPTVSLATYTSNYDFPTSKLPLGPNLPIADLRTLLTPPYTSPMGALHSYDFAPEGRIAPCLNVRGYVCYGGLYSFFDPDSFFSVSSLLTTFDPDAWEQARKLIDTNGLFFCGPDTPATCEIGQMIHHFVPNCDSDSCYCAPSPVNPDMIDCVTYDAISGASQSGPNIYWTFSALRYGATAGDYTWLAANAPKIRLSMSFLMAHYHAAVGLFYVPGSLFIDTFVRANYTSDTNAAMILLSEAVADMEAFLGNATGAQFYTSLAATLRASLVKYLLTPDASRDHFCTNSDSGASPGQVQICTRDFVDYDANLLAVAAGAADPALARAILARVDSGVCTHARGTYVSEVYYDSSNCVSGNTGDSAITMGRIGYYDSLARKATGDVATFSDTIFGPLQEELLATTWMYERYTCQATPTHNAFYIEYPEAIGMMLLEVMLGLTIRYNDITIAPIAGDSFTLALPNMTVSLNATAGSFAASFPYAGSKTFFVSPLPQGTYLVTVIGAPVQPFNATVGGNATLTVNVPTGIGVTVTAQLQA